MKAYSISTNQYGFTIIETTIAITIIGIGIIALFASLSGSMFLSASSKHKLQAIHLARSTIDTFVIELKKNFDSHPAGTTISTSGAGTDGMTIDYTINTTVTSVALLDNNCKRIVSTVTWQEPATDKIQSLSFESFVCR